MLSMFFLFCLFLPVSSLSLSFSLNWTCCVRQRSWLIFRVNADGAFCCWVKVLHSLLAPTGLGRVISRAVAGVGVGPSGEA